MTIKDALKILGSDNELAVRHAEAKVAQHYIRAAVGDLDFHVSLLEKQIIDAADNIKPNNNRMKVKVKKLHPNAVIPRYAHPGDAGLDLVAVSREFDSHNNIIYDTGLAFELPKGYLGLLPPRSSNDKKGVLLANSIGILDSTYRGPVKFKYRRTEVGSNYYEVGDRIGQLIIIPYPEIELVEVDSLSETTRGDGGFGSTGK